MFDFGKVQLKKTAKKEEKKIDLKEELEKEKQSQLKTEMIQKRVRECDLEEWYEVLKEHTYKSTWIPISISQAKAIININKVNEGLITSLSENDQKEINELSNQITKVNPKYKKKS